VLEAGCGRTTRLTGFRNRIDRLVGADVDEPGGRANAVLDEFVVADLCCALPFDASTFDLVYADFVVEHLEHPGRAFAEWHRVLRPGGSVVLLTSTCPTR
jgi:ubiquinone/menaquinone biosynthesis C-methylase UbiE